MARRTTADKVAAILGGDWDGNRPLVPFIDSVNGLVSKAVTLSATQPFGPIGTETAEILERWLAAWAYAMSDRPLDQKSTGRASGSFSGKTAMHLDANTYGQTAMVLDVTGTLRALNEGRVASVAWLGKPPSEQTDYEDRD